MSKRKTYSEVLLDPRWQKERLAVLDYAEFRCQLCGNGKDTLHVHHSYYTKGKKPWQYPRGSMIVLCDKCHAWFHERKRQEKYGRVQYEYEPPPQSPLDAPQPPESPQQDNLDRESCDAFIAAMRRELLKGI